MLGAVLRHMQRVYALHRNPKKLFGLVCSKLLEPLAFVRCVDGTGGVHGFVSARVVVSARNSWYACDASCKDVRLSQLHIHRIN